MTSMLVPYLRPVAAPSTATLAAMRLDAAALASMFYDAMDADTPVDERWPLAAAVLLEQFSRLSGGPAAAVSHKRNWSPK